MIVTKEVKKVSKKTLEKFNNFDYKKYEDEMNSDNNREKMRDFFHLVSIRYFFRFSDRFLARG